MEIFRGQRESGKRMKVRREKERRDREWEIRWRRAEAQRRRKKQQAGGAALLLICVAAILTSGCVKGPAQKEKLRDLSFAVVDHDAVPDELNTLIEEKKSSPFQLTYTDQASMYIAEGYGAQLTTGYSVEVNELYETEDAVFIHTTLLGPEAGEEIKEISTFPYVVVKLEYIDKNVIFD